MLLTEISCVRISNLVNQIILQAILIKTKVIFPSVVYLLSVSTVVSHAYININRLYGQMFS